MTIRSEAETLRAAITVALAYLQAGGAANTAEAIKALREARATPRDVPPEATGLEYRGG